MTRKPSFTSSGDTEKRYGGSQIVGVEDDDGKPWCWDCANAEIRRAGETGFMTDLYAVDSMRKRCSQCGRRIGEVGG